MSASSTASRGSGVRPRLAVVGHVNLDYHVAVAVLPDRDRTVAVRDRHTELGGTATNLSLAARRAGVPVSLVSRVGSDFPVAYRRQLTAAGIDLRGLETVRGAATPSCIIVHDDHGAQMTFIDQGPMGDASGARVPSAALGSCRWMHLGTGDPEYLLRLQRWARAHSVPVALDPAQEIHYRWTPKSLGAGLSHAELLFGNQAEMEQAAVLAEVDSIDQLTEVVPTVIVTRGRHGADGYFRGGHVHAPARRIPALADPTGAGDAFRGGFYAGWLGGAPLRKCLEDGNRSAGTWLTARQRAARGGRR
ncbi:MAG: PfkB family carbohydrate kinase [Thermoplasmata archaeon]|nr:PfkB family carbohydrate kinase [Thermoplasmata archaeon]